MEGVARFLGIRYAMPPMGEQRFMPPTPVADSTANIDAFEFGHHSYQHGQPEILAEGFTPPGDASEDCLFLNVYAPESTETRSAVLVWILGGAFIGGAGSQYDPSNLVRDHNVIVVTINYRLGVFGFIDHSQFGAEYAGSANLGIQDQVAALGWIQRNIHAFGGDASNVTIFGESARAGSVLALFGTPAAEGLFHKAMAFSGAETLAPAFDHSPALAATLGVAPGPDYLQTLKTKYAEELSAAQLASFYCAGPCIDGVVITCPTCEAIQDGGAAGTPIITGSTRDEGTLLAPDWTFNDEITQNTIYALAGSISRDTGADYIAHLAAQLGDAPLVDQLSRTWDDLFHASGLRVAAAASAHGAGGWAYQFEVPTNHPLGITHFSDVPYTFKWIKTGNPRVFAHPPTEENQQLSEHWAGTLMSFAKTGSPNGAGMPVWPAYATPDCESMCITHYPRVVTRHEGGDLLTLYRVLQSKNSSAGTRP